LEIEIRKQIEDELKIVKQKAYDANKSRLEFFGKYDS
jgi:hypothetical protein